MKTTTRWTTACVFLLLLALAACGMQLPPIEIVVAPPVTTMPPAPVLPPIVEPDPPVRPEPTPIVELPPLVNLNIVVHDAAGVGIATAACAISGATESGKPESREAQQAGDINFAVRGSVMASCSAKGYVTASRDLPPGNHHVTLESIAAPAPPTPVEPPPPTDPTAPVFFTACGPRANPTENRRACVDQVARVSANWTACQDYQPHAHQWGDNEVSCHRFVLEVARALAAGDRRWGLITKRRGESACTFDRCGDDLEHGFGEDVVAYLPDGAPANRWLGADLIGCFGCPVPTDANHPSYHWPSEFRPELNRAHNLWAPVP